MFVDILINNIDIMQIKIWQNEAEQRLDRFLRKYFKPYSEIKLSDIFAWIRKGAILVNGKKQKQDYRLSQGDIITFNHEVENLLKTPSQFTISKQDKKHQVSLEDIQKMIIYEDENWLVFNKPAGIVVHPGNKHLNDLTLHDLLDVYSEKILKICSDTFKPSFAFRLDKDTSWIIIAWKNYQALRYLNDLIRKRQTKKTYLAIVKGKAPKHTLIDMPLFRWFNRKFGRAQSFVNLSKGVPAQTEIWNIKTQKFDPIGPVSLVKVKLHTWRMHQIRAHLAHIGHPIVGDIMYGDEKVNKFFAQNYKIVRQLLHSRKYGFYDKFKNKNISFEAPIPEDFEKLNLVS